ncbi:MAG TPA: precorrin-8X methylmutase, partial [Dehalococcoidia bacterium]|nr:precorrin-8X methylmutase [Dehalococcoidia bacterium]
MSLVQQYALLPDEIDRESLKLVQASLPRSLGLKPDEHYVLCRIVRAEGDSGIAESVRFSPGAVESGLVALKSGANVVTDVRMVEMGISRALLRRHNLSTRCLIDAPQVAARAQKEGTTRSVAAVRELAPYLDGAIVAVGNAPTALLALLDLIDEGSVHPA